MIYKSWEEIPEISSGAHDELFLNILKNHGVENVRLLVPLKARYTKGRRWSEKELIAAIDAWHAQKSITFVAACLNRNPQDMIYKLLDYCKSKGIEFTQKNRSESSSNWCESVKSCAEDLFENGLPAWKIATIFKVDFEHVEKELFARRDQYGHKKKNPFGINTDHKQLVNSIILGACDFKIKSAFEPFAGEGRLTRTILNTKNVEEVVCVEQDATTYETLISSVKDKRVITIQGDNLDVIGANCIGKFDLIDLDPFVTCHEQLGKIWQHLNAQSLLFLTFGGEYRRSFIRTNRQSIATRYGFFDDITGNKDYLEIVPYFFLGHVAKLAAEHNFTFNVIRAVRYANNCRFWLEVKETKNAQAQKWFENSTKPDRNGYIFTDLKMPRFREIRSEIDKVRAMKENNEQ